MDILNFLVLLPSHILNLFFGFYTGGNKRPIYFDTNKSKKELKIFEEKFEIIEKEYKNIEKLSAIPAYEDLDKFQTDRDNPSTKWKVFVLNMMGEFDEDALDLCPGICAMIKDIPDVFQAMFSVLEPGRSIPAHKGPYMGYLRYHIGVKIPKENPPMIRIMDTYYTWKKGEGIIFDDSWDHEVINNATEERVVLIIDILRPLPKIPQTVNRLITYKLIKLFYAKGMLKKNKEFINSVKENVAP